MKKLLELKNVSLNYQTETDEIEAINGLTFDCFEGDFLSIIGPSGCGKTTVLSLIAGLFKCTSGQILIDNESENIKKLRLARGLNQVEFAKILSVTKQCVSNWENDNVVPSIDMLCKIADFFGVSTDDLLGRSEKIVIEVSGLTDEQISHLVSLIDDLTKLNELKNR